jgi:serine protease Do
MRKGIRAQAGILVLALALLAATGVSCGNSRGKGTVVEVRSAGVVPTAQQSLEQTLGEFTLSDVAEKTIDSVVNITATTVRSSVRDFFGRGGRGNQRPRSNQGSGVIVSADGIILTSNHMVDGTNVIRVTLHDRRLFDAEIVGTDPQTDLAVIRLKGKVENLKPIPFGDSDSLRLAEVVLAIGNPFGFGHTVTMGIVSAKGRNNVGLTAYEDFIQTDTAINPGNSGGALINLRGELVGINTAIATNTGQYEGVGFAIPSNMARSIMLTLAKGQKVVRGFLGVSLQDIAPDMADALGLETIQGALISLVTEGGPAQKAGLRVGDVILSVNGKIMDTANDLTNTISMLGANKTVTLRILRNKKEQTVTAKLTQRTEEADQTQSAPRESITRLSPAGLELSTLTSSVRSRFSIPADVRTGVVITSVVQGSTADNAGLRPGDVVQKINDRNVSSVDVFTSEYENSGNRVLMYVWSGGTYSFKVLRKE